MSKLRIIGGRWRNHKISFKPEHLIRPTANRVRETLFNWLQAYISGARCLDLFSGSGILGFEALSRGADHVTIVDCCRQSCQQIQLQMSHLGATDITIQAMDAEQFLQQYPIDYDIVFLDPPFYKQWVDKLLPILCAKAQHQPTLIYTETEREHSYDLPKGWYKLHNKYTQETRYGLIHNQPALANRENKNQ